MAGDPINTAVWGEADVYIAPLATAAPATNVAFSTIPAWKFVGLLDGAAGFAEAQSLDQTDHNAWGYGVVATTYKGQKTTRTFTCLEDNSTVMGLFYDTSGMTFNDTLGTYSGPLGVKDYTESFKIAFEVRSGGKIKRYISANYAQAVPSGDATEGEDNLQARPVTVTVFPTSGQVLWTTYKGAAA